MRLSSVLCRIATITFFLFVGVQVLSSAPGPVASTFGPKWNSLVGQWKGENQSGAASGGCSFRFDLGDHVIIRTNHAELSPGAAPHDDLMVLTPDSAPDKAKASYYDNEGHVIEYIAEWSADGNALTFNSKSAAGPQFRLTYKKLSAESFLVIFEMAPPGTPSNFRPYTSGKITRVAK